MSPASWLVKVSYIYLVCCYLFTVKSYEFNPGLFSSLPDDAKRAMINSLTLRHNFDLLYEQLEPSLLMPMLNRNLSYAEKRGRVESYHKHRHAQNAATVESMLSMSIQTNISEICLALGGNNDQQRIAQTLLKGTCIFILHAYEAVMLSIICLCQWSKHLSSYIRVKYTPNL